MPGQRSARARARGSWAVRLAGMGFAVLIAGSGAAVYVLAGHRHVTGHGSGLPARVASEQAVGLASPGPAGQAASAAAPELLAGTPHGLEFTPVKPTDLPAGYPEWTADQMGGATSSLTSSPGARCLPPRARRPRCAGATSRSSSAGRAR